MVVEVIHETSDRGNLFRRIGAEFVVYIIPLRNFGPIAYINKFLINKLKLHDEFLAFEDSW